MLQAVIETRLILHQPDNLTQQPSTAPTQAREFNVYSLTSFSLHFMQSETKMLKSLEDKD